MKFKSTIYRQIILKITIPVIIALIVFAKINFDSTKDMLVNSSKQKSELISDEIHHIFRFKEIALEDLESRLESEMERLSNRLVNYYFDNTDSISKVDLDSIRGVLGVDTTLVDLYIIDTNKHVINTTMNSDLGTDLSSFGMDFSNFLDARFDDRRFYCSRFGIEIKTNNLKKYSYEKTNDGKYLIEIGHYSNRADEIIKTFNSRLDSISNKQKSILLVELFVDDHNPLTLNKAKQLPEIHRDVLALTFKDKKNHTLVEVEDGVKIHYEYIYSIDEGDSEEFGSVVRIKSNKSIEEELLRLAFIKTLLIFGGTILALIILLFFNARNISRPIKELVKSINEVFNNGFLGKVEVRGNNEISKLTEQFNLLLEKLNAAESVSKRKSSELADQSDELQSKSEGVSDSIKYAKRIQHALLPSEEKVNSIFKNNFVFYKTKSVVSGDFYWFEEIGDHKFFAVIDCTGHGVPGAFVSLVGLNALNRSVREFNLRKPGEILHKVNDLVSEMLKQSDADSNDEMDIALCVYSKNDKKLVYAGANSPLSIVRNAENGNIIINNTWSESAIKNEEYFYYDIRGDRKPIGRLDDEEFSFKNFEIEIKQNDLVYLYTDGITDQFGGSEGKKFRAKNLKTLLLEIQGHSMSEQSELVGKSLSEWMQGDKYELLDDMCVLGIKF
jgi:serine phosphatase RsbU (regulator of sigma subunit)